MAQLTGNTIATTYLGILSVSAAVGTDGVEAVTDGAGTATSLSLSQQRATITLGSGAGDDFIVDGTTLVVEGDTDSVGIGTTNPSEKLHVYNSSGQTSVEIESTSNDAYLKINSDTDENQDSEIIFESGGTARGRIEFDHNTNADLQKMNFLVHDDATVNLTLINGDVGVNKTDPAGILHLKGANPTVYIQDTEATDADSRAFIVFGESSSGGTTEKSFRVGKQGSDGYQWSFSADDNDTEAGYSALMTLDPNGRLGIGIDPADMLHVADPTATNYVARFEHTEAGGAADPRGVYIKFATDLDNSDDYFLLCQGGTTSKTLIKGDGDVWTIDDGLLSSDERMKENIVDATSKLDDLLKLKVRNFNWKSKYKPDSSKKIGFIAQEVEEVFPALVREGPSPIQEEAEAGVMRKEIKQSFFPIVIKAIQELSAKVTALENA